MPFYKERFQLLAEHPGLDAKNCAGLFFDGLLPTLKLAINIQSHHESLKETCREFKRIRAYLPVVNTASDSATEACVAIAGPKPFDLPSHN